MLILPFKLNQDRRHHIPKQKHRVANWPAYDAALRQRGSLTVWFSDEAIAAWRAEPRTTRGGQASYSPLAITTAPYPGHLRTLSALAHIVQQFGDQRRHPFVAADGEGGALWIQNSATVTAGFASGVTLHNLPLLALMQLR